MRVLLLVVALATACGTAVASPAAPAAPVAAAQAGDEVAIEVRGLM